MADLQKRWLAARGMHHADQRPQRSGREEEWRRRHARQVGRRLGTAGWDQLVAATIGPLNHQMRFAAVPLAPHDGDHLPCERMMPRGDANPFDVSATRLLSLMAGVASFTSEPAPS